MGIHGQGRLPERKKEHTASCLMSDPGQTHQVIFGFSHSLGLEKAEGDTTLFPLDLPEHLLDSSGLDLAQSPALNDLGDVLCGSRSYSFPAIEVCFKRGKSPSRIGVRGILGQYGSYEHIDRVSVWLPLASAVFLFQEPNNFFNSHRLKNIMSVPFDAKMPLSI